MKLIPKEITQLEVAFGPKNLSEYLPDMKDIPDSYKRHGGRVSTRLANKWFFGGLEGAVFHPREGVDVDKAIRHIGACLGSFEPAHEHKEAGVGMLLGHFFEKVEMGGEVFKMSIEV